MVAIVQVGSAPSALAQFNWNTAPSMNRFCTKTLFQTGRALLAFLVLSVWGLGTSLPTVSAKPVVSFQIAASSATEGQATLRIYVQSSEPMPSDTSVQFGFTPGSANANDFIGSFGGGPIIWSPAAEIRAGESVGAFDLTIFNDDLDEFAENATFTIAGNSIYDAGIPSAHVVTIEADPADTPPTISFNPAANTVIEGDLFATVTARLSKASGKPITVNWTRGGTATAGTDYSGVNANGTFTFDPSITSRSFTVHVLDDLVEEPDKTVAFTLSSPVNASIVAPSIHTLTIQDNDVSIRWGFVLTNVLEGNYTVTLPIQLSRALTTPLSFRVNVGPHGLATAGEDYLYSGESVTIPAGQIRRDISIPIRDDSLDE